MLATVSVGSVNQTVPLPWAGVRGIVLLAPSKESLAAFACDDSVVDPGRLIATNFAWYHFNLCSHGVAALPLRVVMKLLPARTPESPKIPLSTTEEGGRQRAAQPIKPSLQADAVAGG